MAAARKVSAAHSNTLRPSDCSRRVSFPMDVVFPAPLTPTTMMIAGGSAYLGHRALSERQDFEQVLADQILQLGRIAFQVPLHALPDAAPESRPLSCALCRR